MIALFLALIIAAIAGVFFGLILISLCQTAAPQTAQERRYEDEEQMRHLANRRED